MVSPKDTTKTAAIKTIERFRDEHHFLSNFWMAPVMHDGILYPSAEHAYQAAKFKDRKYRETIAALEKPVEAKIAGQSRKYEIYDCWFMGRDFLAMHRIVEDKFTRNSDLGRELMATKNALLIEGNHWHDNHWGHCVCEACHDKRNGLPGENKLGLTLMVVRSTLVEAKAS